MKNQVLSEVKENPGIHFRQLQRNLDCTSTTLNYHLDRLNLRDRKIRGYRRIYPGDLSEELERPLAALNHSVRGPMIYYISEGDSASELVEKLDVSKSTVSSHLKVLNEDGLVNEEKEGRSKKLSVSEKSLKAINRYSSELLDEASDGFIEMWE